MRGDLGQPEDGWPETIQKRVLKGEKPFTERPGARLEPLDLEAERARAEEALGVSLSATDFASHLMYPKVFADYAAAREQYGPTAALPTPVYFYGLAPEDEIQVEIEKGKTLVICCLAVGEPDEKGMVTVYFELNGQPRRAKVPDRAHGAAGSTARRKVEAGNELQIGAPMPGVISTIGVSAGQKVKAGDVGNGHPCRARRDRRGSGGLNRRPGGRQGSAGRLRIRLSAALAIWRCSAI